MLLVRLRRCTWPTMRLAPSDRLVLGRPARLTGRWLSIERIHQLSLGEVASSLLDSPHSLRLNSHSNPIPLRSRAGRSGREQSVAALKLLLRQHAVSIRIYRVERGGDCVACQQCVAFPELVKAQHAIAVVVNCFKYQSQPLDLVVELRPFCPTCCPGFQCLYFLQKHLHVKLRSRLCPQGFVEFRLHAVISLLQQIYLSS
mmetsp:Transcript_67541/g.133971  ORF Transcript_67541/g.133971 Transcript_67541/m.133971 type:complete len:201 (-) Transcript_67541:173-775(-)